MPAVNSHARTIVRYSSTALALIGWAGGLWSYLDHGFTAGIHPGFIASLSVGIAFTMVAGQWWMLPDRDARQEQAAVYGMGYQAGLGCGACPLRPTPEGSEPTRRLDIVRP